MFDYDAYNEKNTNDYMEKQQEISDMACEVVELRGRLEIIAGLIHYPKHWDTACYPTLESAISEIGCSECRDSNSKATEFKMPTNEERAAFLVCPVISTEEGQQ